MLELTPSACSRPPEEPPITTLFHFHRFWGYVAIGANAIAGLAALVAWRQPRLRGRWVWYTTIAAEAALLLQVLVGVILVTDKEHYGKVVPRFHMFYGFVAFIAIGLAYQYRDSMRGRLEMFYGFVGLFLMGVGIRAVMQVT
ncbi:MAG: hypothetical protein U0V73_07040 [Acidimicrobiia bacterium]